MIKRLVFTAPIFATSIALGMLGVTLLLAATHSAEFGCAVLARD